MFGSGVGSKSSDELPSDFGSVMQRIAIVLLSLVALACAHAMLYHLHYILAPFILSGFLVFALEPSVTRIYNLLAGLALPYRWCCCCMHRRWRGRGERNRDGSSSDESSDDSFGVDEHEEAQMLLDDHSGADWEGWATHILDGLCRLIAVVFVLGTLILFIAFLFYLLASGALQIKENWAAYQKGMGSWIAWCDQMRDMLVGQLKLSPALNARVRTMYTSVLVRFQDLILELVNMMLNFVTGSVSFAVIVILYMLFWLFQPLPISGKASTLVQSYLWKKTVVSFLYGVSVALLLRCLGIDLPAFFGLVSFFLNFVPEVGALISMLAPVPLILLNGNIQSPVTYVIISLIGQVVLKLMIGNVLELRLVSADDEMSLHPVWVLLSLNYFGFLWGPVGMLISVPLLATLKSIVISREEELKVKQPYLSDLAGQVLACLEGRGRKDERRRSTWLLPFAGGPASMTPKEKDLMQDTLHTHYGPIEEAPHTTSPSSVEGLATEKSDVQPPVAAATAPKKPRQPEASRSVQADAEEHRAEQP